MGHLLKVNPFKHESRNEKKRKARHADRYVEEQKTLDALKQGNYHVLIVDVDQQPPQAESDNDYSYGHEQNSGDQSTSQVNTNDILSAWGSIPWDVISSSDDIQPSQSRYLLLDPSFIAAAQARDRDIDAQSLPIIGRKRCRNCLPPTCGFERKPATGLANRPSRIFPLGSANVTRVLGEHLLGLTSST
ncbi:hypothetical protein H4Q26_000013 [Puccinia striiformis f. sp. tritici PST-130]|nr:hypothetical protein H4Q26_000013 [Puccinia striiformis f. sp. tritici PST-130]